MKRQNHIKPIGFLVLILVSSCSKYSAGDLNGKWICTIENDPIELWIMDTLALSMNYKNQFLNTYKVEYDKGILIFSNIGWLEGSTWQEKILSLEETKFKTELQNPINKRVVTYNKISSEVPSISDRHEINHERLEEYLKSKLLE